MWLAASPRSAEPGHGGMESKDDVFERIKTARPR
jgi:hypothetical protein